MKLKNIEWRNFKSYSNIPTEIDFPEDSSLNLIIGDNGTGKTSIAEAITFALYGKLDKFNNSDIPNRINKNLYLKIELDCDGHDVVIERGLSPSIFAVKIDGQNIDTAGKSNVQSMLEETYFKMPQSVFNNIIVLSVNDFKTLIDLSAADKRNIMDKIFGFTIYNQYLKVVKEKLKNVSSDLFVNEGSIRTSTNHIGTYVKQIDELSKSNVSEDELNELRDKIRDIENLNKTNENIIQKINNIRDELKNSTFEKSGRYKELNMKIESIDKKVRLIDLGKCPTCGSSLETEGFLQEKESLLNQREEYVKQQEQIKKDLLEIKSKLNALDRKEKQTRSNIKGTEIVNLKFDLKYKTEIKESNIEPIIKLKKELDEELSRLNDENNKLSQQKIVLDIMADLFGENGIKKFITSKYTPQINHIIAEMMEYMNLNYTVEFDDNFNGNITQGGYNIKYSTLSTGEKKRIDFACILSIIKFLKLQGEMNLLFLDELFSNIDISGVSDMIELLKNISMDLNMNIFLIHHAPLEGIVFDKIYKTSKPDGFSRLEQVE